MPFCRKTDEQILYLRKRDNLRRMEKEKVMVQHSLAKITDPPPAWYC